MTDGTGCHVTRSPSRRLPSQVLCCLENAQTCDGHRSPRSSIDFRNASPEPCPLSAATAQSSERLINKFDRSVGTQVGLWASTTLAALFLSAPLICARAVTEPAASDIQQQKELPLRFSLSPDSFHVVSNRGGAGGVWTPTADVTALRGSIPPDRADFWNSRWTICSIGNRYRRNVLSVANGCKSPLFGLSPPAHHMLNCRRQRMASPNVSTLF